MTTRPVGLVFDLEARPTLAARPHDSVILGIVGTAANATANGEHPQGRSPVAKLGSVYTINSVLALSAAEWTAMDAVDRENLPAATPAAFFGVGSILDTINLAEAVGNFTLIVIPVDGKEQAAAVKAVNDLDPGTGGGTHDVPGIIAAPDAVDADAERLVVASALRTIATKLDAKAVVRIPDSNTTAANRKAWAGTFVPGAASPGTIRRTRVTLGDSKTGATGDRDVSNDAILAVYMALVDSEDLGEDPANTHTLITSTDPVLPFGLMDFTTAAQDLAANFITPVVRYEGSFRFWGRASGPDPDDDFGYVGVLDAIFHELMQLLGGYSQRNLSGEDLEIMVTRGQHLVNARRRLGQIADGVVSRHPSLDTPERLNANELYLLLATQRVPYARLIHVEITPHGVTFLGTSPGAAG